MATLLLHSYSPAPRHGILLNPNHSPSPSPAYHPAQLPALVPSNSSLSSSSSSAPGDASDYFSPVASNSKSSSPGPSHGSPAPLDARLPSLSKPRSGSNHSTVRRIRFAPLPEVNRDEDMLPPVIVDDDDAPHLSEHQLTMSAALAAANVALSPHGDSDFSKRVQSLTPSAPSSPSATRRSLPSESLLLGASASQSSSDSAEPAPLDGPAVAIPSQLGDEWNALPSSSALTPLSFNSTPDSPRKAKKWSKVFKPLLGRSGPKSPLPRTYSKEDTASINIETPRGRSTTFLGVGGSRNSSLSRDASLSRTSDFGAPLDRWTSEGAFGAGLPVSKKKKHSLFGGGGGGGGVPLGRTQSLTSLSGKDDKKAKAPPPLPSNGGRKQQRMLNGRVYGAKRKPNNANPFANVRTDEPEFVEWGYGGMGSVKNAGQTSIWSRVQAGDDAAGLAKQATSEEDDGSGMAWMKRRKEQREKEAAERAAREKAEAKVQEEPEVKPVDESERQAEESAEVKVDEQKAESKQAEADKADQSDEGADVPFSPSAVPLPSTPALPTSSPSTPLASDAHRPPQIEHITKAVTIPAPSPHHRHHHTHSLSHVERRESGEIARATPVSSPRKSEFAAEDAQATPESSITRVTHPDSETDGDERESLSSSAMSTTSDDADVEDGDAEESPKDTEGGFGQDEDDELEEDEEVERSRLTALGAGVEKFARHHKEEQSQSTVGTPAAEMAS
ncbi:hypothetical protein C8Q80DRAFT_1125005 [Daedaleopsis nitida]|nr:hypothetical protein C8Q80DRAFT_1125005 [Daedaleopsis nitida]